MLRTRELSKTYGKKVEAVKQVSFEMGKGQILGLLGPNGAGKSSLFNMVTLQIERTTGEIELRGRDIRKIEKLEKINITA